MVNIGNMQLIANVYYVESNKMGNHISKCSKLVQKEYK